MNNNKEISTGYKELDKILNGEMKNKKLIIFGKPNQKINKV